MAVGLRAGPGGMNLLVRVAAAPEKGKANEELVSWLSDELEVPRRELELLSGQTSRLKRIGLPASCLARLECLVAACALPKG
jgi:uncharacterized protein YggU (UPF0235/DUF167 family)